VNLGRSKRSFKGKEVLALKRAADSLTEKKSCEKKGKWGPTKS